VCATTHLKAVAIFEQGVLAEDIAGRIYEIFWVGIMLLRSAGVLLRAHPNLAQQLVHHPSGLLELTAAAQSVPELVGLDKLADFIVELWLLHPKLTEAQDTIVFWLLVHLPVLDGRAGAVDELEEVIEPVQRRALHRHVRHLLCVLPEPINVKILTEFDRGCLSFGCGTLAATASTCSRRTHPLARRPPPQQRRPLHTRIGERWPNLCGTRVRCDEHVVQA
jgi:hypothetical protein